MDKLRQELAARYKQAPQEDKPQVRICGDCKKSVYDSKVCMETGRLHDLDKAKVIGGVLVDPSKRTFTGRELIDAIDKIRVRWQAAKTQHVRVDVDSINIFQSFVLSRQWRLQRFGILYGTVDSSGDVVTVNTIYEPEQRGSETGFELLPDEREARVDKLASLLGWRRVGIICSHPPRNPDEIVVSGRELLLLAREQSRFGHHCVLITVAPNTETGLINAQAWQASEQCVHLFQMGLLHEDKENPGCIESSQPLEIAQEEADDKGKRKCIIKEPSKSVDARWMTAFIAIEAFNSEVVSSRFIRISRPGESPPTYANFKNFINDPKRAKMSFAEKIADFHVLVFLMEMTFDVKTDIPVIVEAVMTKNNAMLVEYEGLIKEFMK